MSIGSSICANAATVTSALTIGLFPGGARAATPRLIEAVKTPRDHFRHWGREI